MSGKIEDVYIERSLTKSNVNLIMLIFDHANKESDYIGNNL